METSMTLDPSDLAICKNRSTYRTMIMQRSISENQSNRGPNSSAKTVQSESSLPKGSYFSKEGSIFCGGTGTRNHHHRRGVAVSLHENFLDSLVICISPGSGKTFTQSVRLQHKLIRNDMIRRGPLV